MTTDAVLTELRSLPGAPDGLRARVRALPEPQPRFAWTFPVRRAVLVAAPAVLVLGLGAAALHGVLSSGPRTAAPTPVPLTGANHGGSGGSRALTRPADSPTYRAAVGSQPLTPGTVLQSGLQARPLAPSATRLNKYEAWLRVRVARDELSSAATRAMQIARGYGGYVASVDMNTPGKSGVAALVLRIPVAKVQDAVLRLEKLGDVTSQHVRIQDLQRAANLQQQEILKLRTTIASLQQRLADPNLSAAERVQLEYRLARAKQSLAQKTKAHATTVREGTLATVSATFFVPQPAAAKPHHQGRLERTVGEAGSFLVRELAWLLFAVIVFAPVALLALGAVVALRAGRRRSDARLLEGV